MNVGDIMSVHVHTIGPEESVGLISEVLRDVEYHHLLVEEHDRLIGIISDRDVSRVMSPFLGTSDERDIDRGLLNRTAKDIMTPEPITVSSDAALDEAAELLLLHTISCLPVVNDGLAILGVITWKDLLRHSLKNLAEDKPLLQVR